MVDVPKRGREETKKKRRKRWNKIHSKVQLCVFFFFLRNDNGTGILICLYNPFLSLLLFLQGHRMLEMKSPLEMNLQEILSYSPWSPPVPLQRTCLSKGCLMDKL